jgi:hypothetical protein
VPGCPLLIEEFLTGPEYSIAIVAPLATGGQVGADPSESDGCQKIT